MAKQSITVRTKGRIVSVKAGSNVESFDMTHLRRDEVVDRVYWCCLTGGVRASRETLYELLRENRVLP